MRLQKTAKYIGTPIATLQWAFVLMGKGSLTVGMPGREHAALGYDEQGRVHQC